MVGPGPKQQLTGLLVVRELLYVHGADALQHTGEVVVHGAVRVDVRAVFLQSDEIIRNAERFRAVRNFKLLIKERDEYLYCQTDIQLKTIRKIIL